MRFPAEQAVPIPRRWAWTIGVGVALLAALLVWLLLAGLSAASSGPVTGTARSEIEGAQRRLMGPVPLRATPAPVAADPDDKSTRGVDEYEICGGTWVKANADGNLDDQALKGPMRRDEALQAVARSLAADTRPVAQAALLILQLMDGGEDRRRALVVSTVGCGLDCAQATGVPAAAFDALATSRDSLARLAATTTDPATYALAYRMCGSGRIRAGSCGLLSAEQWARLDPGNAVPWFDVLAQARKESAAANEALHRIATSQRSDQRFFELPGLLIEAAPDDDALRNGVFMLAMESIAYQAAWVLPAYQTLVPACSRDALRDSNRRQVCEAIGELMAEKSDTMFERGLSTAVGRQVGWSEERIERMRAEESAFSETGFAGIEPREALGCAGIRRMTDDLRRKARLGEVGAMREWLAHNAPPPDELLRRYRAQHRVAAEQSKAVAATRAASAASTPG